MSKKTGSTIMYLNTIHDVDKDFRIMFVPDVGDDRKKQEVIKKSISFYKVLSEEIGAVYNFFDTARSSSQKREVNVTEIIKPKETDLKDLPGDTNIEKLESIGKKIYQSLFPDQLKKYMKNNPIDTIVLLSTEYYIPFELMHDGDAFLATKYDFYRTPILDEAEINLSSKATEPPAYTSIITNPTEDLPAAEEETKQIINYFKTLEDLDLQVDIYSRSSASYRALSKIFSQPRLDIFHYCGHSGVTEDNIYFHLPDDPYSVTDIYLQYPSLFFLNMCESDITVQQKIEFKGEVSLNFPMAIMQRGAKACLATLWPIMDSSAAQFAINFYKHLFEGDPVGTAIRKTKKSMAETSDPNDITWLSFILYGRPGLSALDIPRKIAERKEDGKTKADLKEETLIFFIYAEQDTKPFQIKETARALEVLPNIRVKYSGRDLFGNVANFISQNIYRSDIVVLFCSKNADKSRTVKEAYRSANLYGKEIIPVYKNNFDIPPLLRSKFGIQYTGDYRRVVTEIQKRIMMLKDKK
ncbi:MAG: CHAT domain-containing protein [Promethearchaeota archaeon]|nr:MAG: CHAT domain-containing protein [Candidatus Lokiarchaeota archaeon]